MIFNTSWFLVFLALFYAGLWLVPGDRVRLLYVLLASAVDSGAAAELLAMTAGASAKQPKTPKGRPIAKGGVGKPVKPKPKNDFDP